MILKVSASKCKILVFVISDLIVVDEFRYLEMKFSKDNSGKTEGKSRILRGKTIGSTVH